MIESLVAGPNFDGLRRAIFVSIAGRFFAPELPSNLRKISSDGRNVVLEVLLARLPTRTLAEISSITKGRTGIKDAIPGKFPLVVTAEARGSSDHFDFEGPAVIIPTVSSTGHGDASLKRVHFQDGQYAVGSILAVVQPKAPDQISARFLHTYLSAFKDELLVSRMVGTANVSLTVAKIGTVPVPLLPIAAQRKVDELMALCDRLETRQSDAQAAHARLVDELLGSLLQARDAEEFAECWGRVKGSFDVLFTTEQSVDALKQSILRLAVMGKLVEQDPTEEPANSLMSRLRKDRANWLQANSVTDAECRTMLRKLDPIKSGSLPFSLPKSWQAVSLIDCCRLVVDCHNKTAPYTGSGIPIIRTSNIRNREFRYEDLRFVSEETYEFWSRRCPPAPGDIMFTREAPMGEAAIVPLGKKFCLGQRIMLIRPMSEYINTKYLLLALTEPNLLERASTDAIGSTVKHLRVGDVENLCLPLPPFAEQNRIVAKVDELTNLCDQVKAKLARAQALNERLAGTLVERAVS